MNEKNQNQQNYEKESFYFFAVMFRNKWFLIVGTLIGIITSVIVSLMLPNWYKATTNVVPPNDDDTGLGSAISGISSTLKDFGLSKLGGQGGEAYTYIVILESRTVKDSMIKKYDLAKAYDIPDTSLIEIRKEFEANLVINYEKEGNYTISIWDKDPYKAADMANSYINIANQLAVKIAREEARMNTEYLEQRIAKIDSSINNVTAELSKFSKDNMVFSFEDQAKAIASAFAEMKAQEMQYDILHDMYKNTYGADDPMTQDLKSIKEGWSQKIENAQEKPGFAGNFPLKDATEVGVEYMKLYVELETYAKVKSFLLPNLEEARLKEVKNTKNLYVVDSAIPPNKKDKPKRSVIVIGSTIGSFSLMIMAILMFNAYRNFKKKYNEIAD